MQSKERISAGPEADAEWQATLDEYQRQLEAQFAGLRGDPPKPEREGYWTKPKADPYAKFAGGFVSGKYSPLSQKRDKTAAPSAHIAGSPLAAGGKYEHGGWKDGTPAAPPPTPIAPQPTDDDEIEKAAKKKPAAGGAFDETKHPRAPDGEFGSGGGAATKKPVSSAPESKHLRYMLESQIPQAATDAVARLNDDDKAMIGGVVGAIKTLMNTGGDEARFSPAEILANVIADKKAGREPAKPKTMDQLLAEIRSQQRTEKNPAAAAKRVRDFAASWSQSSWDENAVQFRALANVAAGKPFDANIPKNAADDLDGIPSPVEVAAFQNFKKKTAALFDALFPKGAVVHRGINGPEAKLMHGVKTGSTIDFLQPLISSTHSKKIATDFATGEMGDGHQDLRPENYRKPGRIQFNGVRGKHQILSQLTGPKSWFMGEDRETGKRVSYAYQKETVLDGTHPWKFTHKTVDPDGMTVFHLSPLDDEPPSSKKPIKPPAKKAR